ncbi:MAG TPA: alkaline phosphatase family protein [Acidimicrobiales bacterium]|jgi:phospholipase C|nr:alkaline phosphatase family protein [Acidimicrobiales bacterium]
MKLFVGVKRAVMICAAGLGLVALVTLPGLTQGPAKADEHQGPSPIQHLVVIFQENVSFDHYFGTYPNATNASGQPFVAAPGTKPVNGLTPALLTSNPNGANPRRLDPSNINDLLTCDQDHNYTAEQTAFDNGAMDKFLSATGTSTGTSPTGQPCKASDVMNYYDGNTVTGLWNYAQHFAMSDNSFGTTFGPSAPGAINLVSGDTGGVSRAIRGAATDGDVVADGQGGSSLISDAQPFFDDCSSRDATVMSGQNIGDQLNAAGLSWGWFEGGFAPTTAYTGPADTTLSYDPEAPGVSKAVCGASHPIGAALGGTGQWGTKADYIPHHEPFQFYASTANPHHLAPTSLAAIGTDTATPGQFNTANHQYDMSNFDALVAAIHAGTLAPSHLPAVSFLKAPGYEDGHAAYSDPIDEQNFVANEVNALEQLPTWSSTAVVIAYDDSDGFYDHVYSGIHNPSQTSADTLTGANSCGTGSPLAAEGGRCGYGPRLPLLVISPWAKANHVSHSISDQSSIVKFVEDNWDLGHIPGSFANVAGSLNDLFDFSHGGGTNPPLYLNPSTGQPELVPTFTAH